MFEWHSLSDSLFLSSSDESLETFSDYSYDSGTREELTKPVTSSNKSSMFPAKRKYDKKETPLKHPYQDTFTLKHENFEIINHLHIKCEFFYTENLFMLTVNWLNNHKVLDVNVEIVKNFYKAYSAP